RDSAASVEQALRPCGECAVGGDLLGADFGVADAVAIDTAEQRNRLPVRRQGVESYVAREVAAHRIDPPDGVRIDMLAESLERVAEIVELKVREPVGGRRGMEELPELRVGQEFERAGIARLLERRGLQPRARKTKRAAGAIGSCRDPGPLRRIG